MNETQKLELLQQQINDARNGEPENFTLWRQTTEVVLRNVLGTANPLYKRFNSIKYSVMVWSVDTPQSRFNEARVRGVRTAIATLQAAMKEVELVGGAPMPTNRRASGQTIFIVHGHDIARMHEVTRFVTAVTDNKPIILHEQPNEGRTIIEKFEDHAADAAFAVVLATADDLGRAARDEDTDLRPRARQNVLFELGFFFGALGRSKVALLYEEGVERPSDTDGLVRIPLDPAGGWKAGLTRELEAVGLGVDWSALRS